MFLKSYPLQKCSNPSDSCKIFTFCEIPIFPIGLELQHFYARSDFFNLTINILLVPSFEIVADIFTRLSIFNSPEGSSTTFKTRKSISLYFQRRHPIMYNSFTKVVPACNRLLNSIYWALSQFKKTTGGKMPPLLTYLFQVR